MLYLLQPTTHQQDPSNTYLKSVWQAVCKWVHHCCWGLTTNIEASVQRIWVSNRRLSFFHQLQARNSSREGNITPLPRDFVNRDQLTRIIQGIIWSIYTLHRVHAKEVRKFVKKWHQSNHNSRWKLTNFYSCQAQHTTHQSVQEHKENCVDNMYRAFVQNTNWYRTWSIVPCSKWDVYLESSSDGQVWREQGYI